MEFVAGNAPYSPGAQLVQDPEPCREYWPAGHTAAVGLVEPRTQKYPAVQAPEQSAADTPGVAPKRPGGHSVHTSVPPREYWPAGHTAAVLLTEPATQKYPAAHVPEQRGVVSPDAAPKRPPEHSPLQLGVAKPEAFPYRPGAHGAVHALEFMSGVEPKVPALQFVHAPAPASE